MTRTSRNRCSGRSKGTEPCLVSWGATAILRPREFEMAPTAPMVFFHGDGINPLAGPHAP